MNIMFAQWRIAMLALLAGNTWSSAQTRQLIDNSRSKAEEVLLVKVVSMDTCLTASLRLCYSYVRSDIIEIIKRTRFPKNARKFNFVHKVEFDMVHIPKDSVLKIGQRYFVFASTRYIPPDEEVDEASFYGLIQPHWGYTNSHYVLMEPCLGYIEYSEELYKYLKSK